MNYISLMFVDMACCNINMWETKVSKRLKVLTKDVQEIENNPELNPPKGRKVALIKFNDTDCK